MPKAPVTQPIPDEKKPDSAPWDGARRDEIERERQDERAFPDRDPAKKKTGEF